MTGTGAIGTGRRDGTPTGGAQWNGSIQKKRGQWNRAVGAEPAFAGDGTVPFGKEIRQVDITKHDPGGLQPFEPSFVLPLLYFYFS